MSIKQSVETELLDSVGDPDGLEEVFGRYGRSKGPFYLGLAAATAQLRAQLSEVHLEYSRMSGYRDDLKREVVALEAQRDALNSTVDQLDRQVDEAQRRLEALKSVADRAEDLVEQGFGEEELARLSHILGEVAAAEGAGPEEGVEQFFQTVSEYGDVVSMDLAVKRAHANTDMAKAEAERWKTEAKRQEAHAKSRVATIDLVHRLLNEGVKEKDFRQFAKILGKAGVAPEALAAALAKYVSLEELYNDKGRQAENLAKTVRQTKAALVALQDEQAEVKAGIATIRDGALREMEQTGQMARQHVNEMLVTARRYGEFQQQAKALGEEITLARAFKSLDPEEWSQVPRWGIQRMIMGAIIWAKNHDPDLLVSPPDTVRFMGGNVMPWLKIGLADMLLWAFSGLVTEEEREAALASGR